LNVHQRLRSLISSVAVLRPAALPLIPDVVSRATSDFCSSPVPRLYSRNRASIKPEIAGGETCQVVRTNGPSKATPARHATGKAEGPLSNFLGCSGWHRPMAGMGATAPEAVRQHERPLWVELLRSRTRVGRSGIGALQPVADRAANGRRCPKADPHGAVRHRPRRVFF